LGQKRAVPTVLDAAAADLPAAFVNAGQRGLQARLRPADLAAALDAVVAAVS
jgi:Cys-tRNA(Pro)/Cys-tRNA(Cys) deacylase